MIVQCKKKNRIKIQKFKVNFLCCVLFLTQNLHREGSVKIEIMIQNFPIGVGEITNGV